jgi:hypothetical protein
VPPTSGRYEDSIIQDVIPAIENTILQGRVRQRASVMQADRQLYTSSVIRETGGRERGRAEQTSCVV